MGERKQAIERYQKGINLLKDGEPCLELVHLYEEAASLYMHAGDNMLAIYASEKALRLAEKLGETRVASRAHGIFGRVFGRIGDTAKARENLERSVELARDSDDGETIRALLTLGHHLEVSEADYSGAGHSYGEALALAQQVGDLPAQVELLASIAQVASYRADWEQMRAAAEASGDLAEREGLVGKLCFPCLLRGILAWREGDWDGAESWCRRAHELAEQVGWSEVAFASLYWLGRTLRDRGDLVAAVTELDRALDVCERAGLIAQSIEATAVRGIALAMAGKVEQGRAAAEEAGHLAERLHYPVGPGGGAGGARHDRGGSGTGAEHDARGARAVARPGPAGGRGAVRPADGPPADRLGRRRTGARRSSARPSEFDELGRRAPRRVGARRPGLMQKLQPPGRGRDRLGRPRAQGPLVVVANQFFSSREVFARLLDDLASDHRSSGTTRAARGSPRAAALRHADRRRRPARADRAASGSPCAGAGDGRRLQPGRASGGRTARTSSPAIVTPAAIRSAARPPRGTDALVASQGVLDALLGMMRTDYRGALNSVFSTSNPELSDAEVRDRVAQTVEHCSQDTAVERMHLWIYDDTLDSARAVGDRLWILEHGTNPWFTGEIAKHTRELLPEANVLEVEAGAVSRPEIAAGVIRRLTLRPDGGCLRGAPGRRLAAPGPPRSSRRPVEARSHGRPGTARTTTPLGGQAIDHRRRVGRIAGRPAS